MTSLTWLRLSSNDISDLSALSGLTSLTWLQLGGNKISDLSALAGLANLKMLQLRSNRVTDISPLRGLTNLTELEIQWNPLNDSSLNDHIPALERRGVTVLFTRLRKGNFDIELVFLDSFTEDQKHLLRLVARRWASVITEDLPDYEFTQGWSGQCGDHSYTIPSGERIDDLRIYVTSHEGEGTAVGLGGPSLLREESHLSVLGCMSFNLELADLLTTGLHEMGHVLGFGPVWADLGFLQDLSRDDPNADTHFNGPLAIAAFNDAGGRGYTGKKVPLADRAHWRGNVFTEGELMLPWGGPALSAITVQSFADLGYGVDVTQADPYTLRDAASAKASAKITAALPSIYGVDVTPDAYTLSGVAAALPSIHRDDRLRERLESAEWMEGRGFDFALRDNRLRGRLAPHSQAEPQPLCGLPPGREPMYVVDPQGRIVRTLGD